MITFLSLFVRRLTPLVIALFFLTLCFSCTMMQLPALTLQSKKPHALAEQLFINGDFEGALREYEQIYMTGLSAEARNNALYGLACTQMMLAHNEDQLVEAIENLQKWDALKGTAPFGENRHLLVLALKQQSERIQKKSKIQVKHENQQNSLIANQQIKIVQMTSTIETLQNQIEKLQNQIAELEAIDKNVQEKRKSL